MVGGALWCFARAHSECTILFLGLFVNVALGSFGVGVGFFVEVFHPCAFYGLVFVPLRDVGVDELSECGDFTRSKGPFAV